MLYTVKALKGYKLDSLDGDIGKVKEFYFDDRHWTVRYLVADTGTWLIDRHVLLSPYALISVDKENKSIVVDLSKKQIADSPSLDSDKPVSRQFEESYYGYYGWPSYWNGSYSWGSSSQIERESKNWAASAPCEKSWDAHLRSTFAVSGYNIEALDGEIGHVSDFVIDDDNWTIRYLIVSTGNWWPGKKVLISPEWIQRVSWIDSKVFVKLTREAVKQSPEFTDDALLTREYEIVLHRHYNTKGHWVDVLTTRETV